MESDMTLATIPQTQHDRAPVAVNSSSGGAVVRSFDDLARLSSMIHRAGIAPADMNTPEKIGVAILWGMEVGLPPMQAIQSIAVINRRPCLWGDALPAMVLSSPVCEYVKEKFSHDVSNNQFPDNFTAICISKRRNSPEEVIKTFSVADAKKAGLWGKAGPWTNYPKRMLQIRARALNFRDNFADVLRGMRVREEEQDAPMSVSATVAQEQNVIAEPAAPQPSILDEYADTGSGDSHASKVDHEGGNAVADRTDGQPIAEAPFDIEAEAEAARIAREQAEEDPRSPEEKAKEWVAAQKELPLRKWVNERDIVNIGLACKEAKVEGVTSAHPFKNIQRVAFVLKKAEFELATAN